MTSDEVLMLAALAGVVSALAGRAAEDLGGRAEDQPGERALGIGQRIAERRISGRPVPWGLRLAFRVADFLVLDMFANYCTGREDAKGAIAIAAVAGASRSRKATAVSRFCAIWS